MKRSCWKCLTSTKKGSERLGSWLVMNFLRLIFHTCPTLSTGLVALIRAICSLREKMRGDGGTRYRAKTHWRRWLICRRVLRKFGWYFLNKLLQFREFFSPPFSLVFWMSPKRSMAFWSPSVQPFNFRTLKGNSLTFYQHYILKP